MDGDELAVLDGQAAAVDAELTPENFEQGAVAPEMVPAGPDYTTEAAMAVDLFAGLVCGFAPRASDLWGESTKGRVSAALAPVLEKYGVSMGNLPPELVLAVVAGPVLWQTAKAVGEHVEDEARKKGKGQGQPVADGGAMAANPAPESGQVVPAGMPPQMALYANGA